jgi:hypothetical protein
LIILPPDGAPPAADIDMTYALAETHKLLHGLISKMDPHRPGMYQADTIDPIYVTEGACVAQARRGTKIALARGDVLIQTGPRHAWEDPRADPRGLLTVSFGVTRKGSARG